MAIWGLGALLLVRLPSPSLRSNPTFARRYTIQLDLDTGLDFCSSRKQGGESRGNTGPKCWLALDKTYSEFCTNSADPTAKHFAPRPFAFSHPPFSPPPFSALSVIQIRIWYHIDMSAISVTLRYFASPSGGAFYLPPLLIFNFQFFF